MSQLLKLDPYEAINHPSESDDTGETPQQCRRWHIIGAVSAMTVVVLLVAFQVAPPLNSITSGEGLDHLTDYNAADGNKDTDMGFPIYFSGGPGGMGIKSKSKQWLITFTGEGFAKDKAKVSANFGDKVVFQGTKLPVLVVRCSLRQLKRGLKGISPGDVEFAEQNAEINAIPSPKNEHPPHHEPHERRLGKQSNAPWGLDRVDGRTLPLDKGYEPKADMKEGRGVHVYVLDTGVRTTHTDFGGRAVPTLETFSGKQKVCGPTDTYCANDMNGHGTHCAGSVAGTKYGVAKQAQVHAVKVLGDNGKGGLTTIQLALDWVMGKAQKPAVVSMSLGGPGRSSTLEKAVDYVTSSGVIVVVAAGNEEDNACDYTPAHIASAVTVAATANTDDRSGFSNYGSCIDIFAPGSNILSAAPTSDTAATPMSGTSMACPHVAGASALLLARNPSKTPQQITAELLQHATADAVKDERGGSPNKLLFVGKSPDDPTPSPTPPAPPNECAANGWKVTEGTQCVIDQDCCLTVKKQPGTDAYKNSERCTIKVGSDPGQIRQEYFHTETGYDILTIHTLGHDEEFSGSVDVSHVHPTAGEEIIWTADHSFSYEGFKLCMTPGQGCPANKWRAPTPSPCQAPSWNYKGKTYKGCDTVDYDGWGWCYVNRRRAVKRWVSCEAC